MGKPGRKKRWPSEKILQRDYWKLEQLTKMTGATESQIRENVKNNRIRHVTVRGEYYVSQKAFIKWVNKQPHYSLESEEIMTEQIRTSISVQEFADLMKVSDITAHNILRSATGKRFLKTFWVANRVRITKVSFFQWLAADSRFGMAEKVQTGKPPDLKHIGKYITDEEAAYLAGVSVSWIAQLRRRGEFPSEHSTYHVVRIPLDGFLPWLIRRRKKDEVQRSRRGRFQSKTYIEGSKNGIYQT